MLPLLADENFNNDIVRGVTRRNPEVDVVRVQDVGLSGADDPAVLAWAARAGRGGVTHDVATMTRFAYDRVEAGEALPGLIEVGRAVATRQAIDDIVLLAECSQAGEWEGQVLYLPLR